MIIDLHCDTIEKAFDNKLKLNSSELSFNTIHAKQNLPHIQCLATFVHSKYDKENKGFKRANEIIDNFYKIYNQEEMFIIKTKEDLQSKELNKKIGVILTIENGTAISGKYATGKTISRKLEHDTKISNNLDNIQKLYKKGIRMMGIVWNDDNDLGCGALTANDTGLTELGKNYIKELVKQKIIIDVSHASKKTFWDTCEIIKNKKISFNKSEIVDNKTKKSNNTKHIEYPIIASHSCVQKLCNHPRNLDDEQIKQIAKTGGVIGICFCNIFLTQNKTATVKDIVNHIDYIANLVGIDYISFGSDFDGLEKEHIMQDIKGVNDYALIIEELKQRGYTQEDIEKICYKNFIRVAEKML